MANERAAVNAEQVGSVRNAVDMLLKDENPDNPLVQAITAVAEAVQILNTRAFPAITIAREIDRGSVV